MTAQLLLVAPAPNREFAQVNHRMNQFMRILGSRAMAVTGDVGVRIVDYCDCTVPEYLRLFKRMNLIEYYPGPAASGKGDAWPAGEAKVRAEMMLRANRGRKIILLGRNVARAFYPRWMRDVAFLDWMTFDELGTKVAVVPHPSRVNRWYNNEENKQRARQFWMDAIFNELQDLRSVELKQKKGSSDSGGKSRGTRD